MQRILIELKNLSGLDSRAAIYYFSRYLKQAAHFDEYNKDFFEDDTEAYPSIVVQNATRSLIRVAEESEGVPISKFNDITYQKWAKIMEDIEAGIDRQASPEELAKADIFINAISTPKPSTLDTPREPPPNTTILG